MRNIILTFEYSKLAFPPDAYISICHYIFSLYVYIVSSSANTNDFISLLQSGQIRPNLSSLDVGFGLQRTVTVN